jgi:hypothetical protein
VIEKPERLEGRSRWAGGRASDGRPPCGKCSKGARGPAAKQVRCRAREEN